MLSHIYNLFQHMLHLIQNEKRSICRFLSVGLLTFFLYYFSFRFLYAFLGIDYIIALSISYLLAISFHFFINNIYTFSRQQSKIHISILKYVCMCIINYFITLIIVGITSKYFLLPPDIGLILSIFATLVSGYLLLRLWVFRNEQV
jgi:putative flippase GtrA